MFIDAQKQVFPRQAAVDRQDERPLAPRGYSGSTSMNTLS